MHLTIPFPNLLKLICYQKIILGKNFQLYEKNPILDLNLENFRDPKIFKYSETKWIMLTALSNDFKLIFWESEDLLNWEKSSEFGPLGGIGGVWECPDLFQLKVKTLITKIIS